MENLYIKLLDFTGDGVYRYTLNEGRVLMANSGLVRILDLDCRPEELVGKRLKDLLIYTAKEGTVRQSLKTHGEIHEFEYHFKTLKGEDKWVIHDAFVVPDPQTGEQVVETIVKDITGLKRAQQELEREKERLAVTLYSIGDGVIATDAGGRIVLVNKVAEQLTGWTQEEALNAPLEQVFHIVNARTRRPCENPVQKVIRCGIVVGLANHTALISRDGTERIIADSGAPIRSREGNIIGVILVFRDVTDQERAEEAMRQSEARLRRFSDSGLLGLLFWNLDGRITDANDKFLEMVGYSREDLAAGLIDWAQMTPPEYRHLDEAALEELKAAGVNKAPYEKEYVRKDGSRIPVIIAAAMLDEARFNGVAFVLNIAERKRAEEALRQSETRYRSLFEHMLNGLAYCQIIFDEQGRPEDFVYLAVNEAFGRITGLQDVVGKRVTQILPQARDLNPELLEIYGRVAMTGQPERFEIDFKPLARYLSISVYSPAKGYFVASFDDITARKQAEEAMLESEQRLEFALETGRIGAWDLDLKDQTAHRSIIHDRVFGYQTLLPEWTYQMFLEHVLPEDRPMVDAKFRRAMETQSDWNFECRIRRVDGEIRWIWAAGRHVFDAAGAAHRMAGIVQDITERKEAEETLRKANRVVKMLNQCNQALVRSTEEEKLLRDICQIIVDAGGYRMAWVGFAEHDENKSVRPVMHAGHEEGYLRTANISWADTEHGRGATGTAIRTGQPSVSNDIQADPRYALWRDAAVQRGYASSIVLPLLTNGQAFGALTMYSDKVGEFDAEEVTLLTELASDLAYGITALRVRAEHKRAEEALQLDEKRFQAMLKITEMTDAPLQEITNFALEQGVQLTKSTIGYLAFMNEDETVLTMHSWSKTAMKECEIQDKPIVYPVVTTGLWGEAVRQRRPVITNDYAAPNPRKKGCPAGHVPVLRHMNIPVFDGQKIVAVAGVGNKEQPYDETDVRQLRLLMDSMWRRIQRQRMVAELRQLNDHLEQRVRQRTEELELAVRSEREALETLKKAQALMLLSEKLAGLGQLVAGVAHEINNPLAFVTNNVVVLQRDLAAIRDILHLYQQAEDLVAAHRPELYQSIKGLCDRIDVAYTSDNLQDLLSRSREGLRRIQQIVKDLRDFAHAEESEKQPVNLNEGIESTIHIIQGRAKKDDVEILLELGSLPLVSCLRGKINQVVMNLVANAIEACPRGGKVTVRTVAEESCVRIEVEDTGHGIEPALLGKVFDPFFTTKPQGQGLGLGLSLSYGIVHDHGGTIEIDSAPGRGSRFIVRLPTIPPPSVKADSQTQAS